MKKHQNLKIHPKYAFLALCSLLMATGCAKREHKNIVTGILQKRDYVVGLLLEDAETGEERFYQVYDAPVYNRHLDCFKLDDTVGVYIRGPYTDGLYKDNKILNAADFGLSYNQDSIYARMNREKSQKSQQR